MKSTIVYFPYPFAEGISNEFTKNMVSLLEEDYDVIDRMDPALAPASIAATSAVILNWAEKKLDAKWKREILAYRKGGAKIIWFFHNRTAHEEEDIEFEAENSIWLADHSDVIALLSRESRQYIPGAEENREKACFIPHITYWPTFDISISEKVKSAYHISDNDFVFLFFGRIRPYKGIEKAIADFDALQLKAHFIIAGKPHTEAYGQELKSLTDNPRIHFILDFLPTILQDNLINLCDAVVMPYSGQSSMNSGVLVKALSFGKTVIAPDICMAKDFQANPAVRMWRMSDPESLKKCMQEVYETPTDQLQIQGRKGRECIENTNSPECVRTVLTSALLPKEVTDSRQDADLPVEVERFQYLKDLRIARYTSNLLSKLAEAFLSGKRVSDYLQFYRFSSVSVYGYGRLGQLLLKELVREGVCVSALIDQKAQELSGASAIPVISPDDCRKEDLGDLLIITPVSAFEKERWHFSDRFGVPVVTAGELADILTFDEEKLL